jgi:HlyD family secretion protein
MGEETELKNSLFSRPGKQWIIALSVLGLMATGATAIYSFQFSKKQPMATPLAATKTASAQVVTALGRIEPQGEVIDLGAPPNLGGAKVAQLLVKEGDLVAANQVVAVLDSRDRALAAVKLAQQEVEVAKANLAVVQAGAKVGEIKAQKATVQRSKADFQGDVATNQAKIDRLEAELQGEIQAQAATIDRLKAELKNAESEFHRYQKLAQDGAISPSNLDQRDLTLDTAKEKVKEAQATFSKTTEMLREEIRETKAIARQAADTRQEQIREAEANLDRIAEVRDVDVQKAQAEVEKAIASRQQAQEDLKLSYVRSPIQGQILKINTLVGETVTEKDGIAELGRTERMIAIAEVYESDIGKIRLGQTAIITSESNAFEGNLQGKVTQVGLQIGKKDVLDTDPAADVDARVVEVKILLNPEDSKRVANLTYSKVLTKIVLNRS